MRVRLPPLLLSRPNFLVKILHTTDLHFNRPWFDWVQTQAENYDLVCLSGDFLAVWSGQPTAEEQIAWVEDWLVSFLHRAGSALAVCSGNHDADAWLAGLKMTRDTQFATDGRSRFFGDPTDPASSCLVTCVPYSDPPIDSMSDGLTLRQSSPLVPWIALAHVPPNEHEDEMGALMEICAPDYILSGHLHEMPYEGKAGWFRTSATGQTCLLNPGATNVLNAAAPNHVIIDTAVGSLEWHHSPQFEPGTPKCGKARFKPQGLRK